jgi:serine/threonine-protein phosphatase PGAM5
MMLPSNAVRMEGMRVLAKNYLGGRSRSGGPDGRRGTRPIDQAAERAARFALIGMMLGFASPCLAQRPDPSGMEVQHRPGPPADRRQGVHYVYLIRHGMYDRDSTADDRVGNHLNALGREQARLVGERLARLPVQPASLVTSDFSRARETAEIIGGVLRMTAVIDTLIHECAPTSERTATASARTQASSAACDTSLAAAWAKYMQPSPASDTHDVLVCHGNVTRWWVTRALGADTRRWPMMDIANASLTIVAVRADGTTRLVMFSDVGHLSLDRQTWTGRGPGWGSETRR